MMTPVLRAVLYTVAVLVGIFMAFELRPITVNTGAVQSAATKNLSGWDLAGDLLAGRWGELKDAAVGSAGAAVATARAQAERQAKVNIGLGVVAGVVAATLVDFFFLR